MFDQLLPTQLQTTLFVWGLFAHVVADWLLQTDWMALHKTKLCHPAAWTHGAIHALCLLWLLPWHLALLLGIVHMLVDTRSPVHWWMRVVKGMRSDSPAFSGLLIWMDQMFHVTTLAVVVLLFV